MFVLRSLVVAMLLLGAPASWAQMILPPQDQVMLSLDAEGWVTAERAKVSVTVDAAVRSAEAGSIRARVSEALGNVAPDAEWRIIDFQRTLDETGLERWHVSAEARLAEDELSNLHERAEQTSSPGLQVRVIGIDFTPSEAERAAKRAELRADLYRQVKAEIGRLAEIYPDRKFRVGMIDFLTQMPPLADAAKVRSMATAEMAAPPLDAGQYLRLTAQVTIYLDTPYVLVPGEQPEPLPLEAPDGAGGEDGDGGPADPGLGDRASDVE